MFLWARKLKKKEGKEESNLSTLGTFKSGFIYQRKEKLYWRLVFRNSIEDWVFSSFTGPKKVFGIIPATTRLLKIALKTS